MHHRDTQRGFTILELMVVVAIIAVLALIVIPSFIKETKRAGYKSEVHPMFAELGTREDQYKVEKGVYLAAAACPPTANAQGTDMTSAACLSNWTDLRVQPAESKLKCSYVVTAGVPGDDPVAVAPTWVQSQITAPAVGWFFIVATCPDNEYFTASWDSKIRSEDGK
ncbi:MAG TPA: prepilin-type N-terminal cleavage/methylation domain-containing protein [Kofleriaceae bacterium]